MKITEIRAIPLAVPLQQVGPPSSWAGGAGKQILVRAATDEMKRRLTLQSRRYLRLTRIP